MYAQQYVRGGSTKLLVHLDEIHSFEGVFILSQDGSGSKRKHPAFAFTRAWTADTNENLFTLSSVNAGPTETGMDPFDPA